MQPRTERQQGFTLFEMMLVMIIISAVTAVGFSVTLFQADALDEGVRLITRQVSEARSRAMLQRKSVTLSVREQELRLTSDQSDSIKWLPEGVRVTAVNALPPDEKNGVLVFHPFGIVRESVIHLEQTNRSSTIRQRTVYVPGAGAPRVLDGHQDLDRIMKELL